MNDKVRVYNTITRARYDKLREQARAGPCLELPTYHPEPYYWVEYTEQPGIRLVFGYIEGEKE